VGLLGVGPSIQKITRARSLGEGSVETGSSKDMREVVYGLTKFGFKGTSGHLVLGKAAHWLLTHPVWSAEADMVRRGEG